VANRRAPQTQVKPRCPSQVAEPISATNGSSRSSAAVRTHKNPVPPRTAQELAAGAGEQVTADRVHVHRELPGRPGGVQQKHRAAGAGDPSDVGGGLDQAAASRHVADLISLVRSLAILARAATSSWPCSSLGTTATSAPVRPATCQ
jgi:hypothetical protein